MDARSLEAELATGVSPICATCKRYWEGRERGLPRPKCSVKERCGSPLCGDTFSHYEGPISDISRWCFMCPREATHGVSIAGSPRVVGICNEHLPRLHELVPEVEHGSENLVVCVGGESTPLLRVVPRKVGLFQAMAESEASNP